ncbi:hypothetical protein AWH48_16910 [Domibacillus aminovorans]|uniref:Ribbon-helix-helix protein CopG domain-containing protein n=1 Tax=Domibacillus aminovorans TaxID=29332 RepID=A0A177KZW5_9BACI|nr:hypothetical protein [Domibacillus aminovorans]OAH58677.1 hypothetical protein AWH48_16910 [Domibacillus aminovorans]
MDVIVRNIDPLAMKIIDELAKKQRISRQEFLKGQLETLAFYRDNHDQVLQLQTIIEKNIVMLEHFDQSVSRMNEFIKIMIEETS